MFVYLKMNVVKIKTVNTSYWCCIRVVSAVGFGLDLLDPGL